MGTAIWNASSYDINIMGFLINVLLDPRFLVQDWGYMRLMLVLPSLWWRSRAHWTKQKLRRASCRALLARTAGACSSNPILLACHFTQAGDSFWSHGRGRGKQSQQGSSCGWRYLGDVVDGRLDWMAVDIDRASKITFFFEFKQDNLYYMP